MQPQEILHCGCMQEYGACLIYMIYRSNHLATVYYNCVVKVVGSCLCPPCCVSTMYGLADSI